MLCLTPALRLGELGRFDPPNVTYWTTVGTNGWHHNDVNYFGINCVHSGTKAVKIWSQITYLYQDFNAIVGKEYKVDVWALSASAIIMVFLARMVLLRLIGLIVLRRFQRASK